MVGTALAAAKQPWHRQRLSNRRGLRVPNFAARVTGRLPMLGALTEPVVYAGNFVGGRQWT
jgi:hypothetical protein